MLVGGPGRRMGRPKAGIPLGAETLAQRCERLLVERCGDWVVVGRPEVELPAMRGRVVMDRPGPPTPLGAVATGMAAVTGAEVLVLAGDLPFAGPALDALLDAPPGIPVVATAGGMPVPLCARYPRAAALAAAERLLSVDALAVRGLLDAVQAVGVEAPEGALLNVNTPADLAAARARLGRAEGRAS